MADDLDILVSKAFDSGRSDGASRKYSDILAALTDLLKQSAQEKPSLVPGIEAALDVVRRIPAIEFSVKEIVGE